MKKKKTQTNAKITSIKEETKEEIKKEAKKQLIKPISEEVNLNVNNNSKILNTSTSLNRDVRNKITAEVDAADKKDYDKKVDVNEDKTVKTDKKKVTAEKDSTKKLPAKKPAENKTTKSKTTKKKNSKNSEDKKTVKRSEDKESKTSKKTEQQDIKKNTYVQFYNREISEKDIIERIKKNYVADGHKLSTIKTMNLYIKPEDNAVYYVINDNTAGKVNLF